MTDEFTDNLKLTKIGRHKGWAEAMNENLEKIGALHYYHTDGWMFICKNAICDDGTWTQPDSILQSSVIALGNDGSFTLQTCPAGNPTITSWTEVASFGSDGSLTLSNGSTFGSDGTLTLPGNVTAAGGVVAPAGMIVIWSGSVETIPTGWALCNGTNGTPDLRDRFIVGAGSTYSVGDTGGEATHTLIESEMPSHYHEVYRLTVYDGDEGTLFEASLPDYPSINKDAIRGQTLSTGGDAAHENRPPYYALCYIMKL